MRTEQEMLALIIGTAQDDERIRAVIMNGSRANPNAPRDPFQDFDIVYLVKEVAPFKEDRRWIERFGETMIIQLPEEMQDSPPAVDRGFAYLMQFTDGNRIDLGIYPVADRETILGDSMSILLVDKDNIIGPVPPTSDSDYLPSPPTAKSFSDCCNEFWWVCPYVAKGLWRQEIIYGKTMLDTAVRDQLMKMLVWHIGLKTDFSVNPGKLGKYFRRYLEPDLWERLIGTYADASYEHTWEALFTMGDLFREVAVDVASTFGFDYPFEDDRRVNAYLEHIRHLPRDAKAIY